MLLLQRFKCLLVLGILGFASVGCQQYQAKPLVPRDILVNLELGRMAVSSANIGDELTFDKALTMMGKHHYELKLLKANYEALLKAADVETPWPNPSIEFGFDDGTNTPSGTSAKVSPVFGFNFTVPLGGKLALQDDIRQLNAKQALMALQLAHRKLYFELKTVYHTFAQLAHKVQITQLIIDNANKRVALTKAHMASGGATEIDVRLMALEAGKSELALLDQKQALHQARATLAKLIGTKIDSFKLPQSPLPVMDNIDLNEVKLLAILIKNHPMLVTLKGEYDIAQLQLQKEIRKQYPDLVFGASREDEVTESTVNWGLRLGVTLPIFDQNQHGILNAKAKREAISNKYQLALDTLLIDVKHALVNVSLIAQQQNKLNNTLLPFAKKNVTLGENALQIGGIDALAYIDLTRTYQQLQLQRIDIDIVHVDSVLALETLIGYPLLHYPSEAKFILPLIDTGNINHATN